MTRFVVVALHGLFAGLFVVAGVWMGLQARVNLLWELSFFGTASPGSEALLLTALFFLGFAGLQVTSSMAYLAGHVRGRSILMVLTLILAFVLPWPLSGLMFLLAVAILVEAFRERLARMPTEPDA